MSYLRFEVLTAKIIKIPVFWGAALRVNKLVDWYHCCRETWCFHFWGRRWMHQMPIESLVPLHETVHDVTSQTTGMYMRFLALEIICAARCAC